MSKLNRFKSLIIDKNPHETLGEEDIIVWAEVKNSKIPEPIFTIKMVSSCDCDEFDEIIEKMKITVKTKDCELTTD